MLISSFITNICMISILIYSIFQNFYILTLIDNINYHSKQSIIQQFDVIISFLLWSFIILKLIIQLLSFSIPAINNFSGLLYWNIILFFSIIIHIYLKNRPKKEIHIRKPSILDLFLIDKVTEDELLKYLSNIIVEVKEDECVICKEVKKVIRICDFENHCYCLYDFCMWYKDNKRSCICCMKEFKLSS